MNKILALSLCSLSILLYPLHGLAAEATMLKVSRVGDTELACGQLSEEALLMSDIIYTTEDIKDDVDIKKYGISAAGALGSFLVSSVTGGAGIAAVGYLLKERTEETSDEVDGIQDIAEQRRSLMVGIYNAKGCFGPIEHAFLDQIEEEGEAETALQLAAVEPAAGEEADKPRYNP